MDELRDPVTPKPKPRPKPRADVRFTTSCDDDYPIVWQEIAGEYRLVAEVNLNNRGNAATMVGMRVDWLFFGGGRVHEIKHVRLGAHQRKRVPINRPASQDEVLRFSGHQAGDRLCRVRAWNY